MRTVLTALVGVLLCLGGCEAPVSDAPPPPDEPSSEASIAWGECSEFITEPVPGEECAVVQVPLRRDIEGSELIDLLVRRVRRAGETDGQLWFLGGGPGNTTNGYTPVFGLLAELAPRYDVYTLGHRGTPGSTELQCVTEPNGGLAAQSCADELLDRYGLDGLAGFRPTEAARDVIELITRSGPPEGEVLLYGLSYGGIWANRIFEAAPGLVTGALLDNPSPPFRHLHPGEALVAGDIALNNLAGSCAGNAECAQRFGANLHDAARDLVLGVEESCSGIFRSYLQRFLHTGLEFPEARAMLPALIHRLDRCNDDDRAAFAAFRDWSNERWAGAGGGPWSFELFVHIGMSEAYERASTPAEVAALADAQPAYSEWVYGSSADADRDIQDVWQSVAYTETEFASDWAAVRPPTFLLSSQYDRRVRPDIDQIFLDEAAGDGDQAVQLTNGSHFILSAPRQDPAVRDCAEEMVEQWIQAPGEPVDTRCNDDLPPPPFDSSALATELFGTADVWGDAPGAAQ